MRKAEIERHTAQLLLEPAIRIRSRQRLNERRFSVVDVASGADYVHALLLRVQRSYDDIVVILGDRSQIEQEAAVL